LVGVVASGTHPAARASAHTLDTNDMRVMTVYVGLRAFPWTPNALIDALVSEPCDKHDVVFDDQFAFVRTFTPES
jgi:hypothetical protein